MDYDPKNTMVRRRRRRIELPYLKKHQSYATIMSKTGLGSGGDRPPEPTTELRAPRPPTPGTTFRAGLPGVKRL
jgi:hypothetical protein